MNKAFDKILERLKEIIKIEIQLHGGRCNGKTLALGYAKGIENAIEIVKEVAEEYTSTEHINCSTNTSTNGWIPIKTRPMTEEEKEYYSEYLFEGNGLIYECPLPDDGQEVLITSKYGSVDKTTFYTDCGNYFENYEDYDEVIAWQSLPQPYKESE